MKRLLFVLIPVAAVLCWLILRRSAPPEIPFVRATRQTIVSTLNTNGKLEPIEWAAVRSEASGSVDRIYSARGATVSKGQLLLTLSAADARNELSRAEAQVSGAKAEAETLAQGGRAVERAEIESGLARARADLANARREFETLSRLAGKAAATRAEVVGAQEAVQRIELQIESLDRRRASLVTEADRSAAQARIREAQSSTDSAARRIELSKIRSPLAGVLYRFDVRPGSYLEAGALVGEVGQLGRLRVVVYVDEPELGRVEQGMPVTITWDAIPGREWSGTVEKKPTQVTTLGTRQVGEVTCTIENPDGSLIPGTNINAQIRSRTVQNAVTVPKEVLRREGAQSGVLKLQGNKVLWQPVKLGVGSVTHVQITEGLSDRDSVALPVDRPLKSGDEVTPLLR